MNEYQWSQQSHTREYWKQAPVRKNGANSNLANLNKFVVSTIYLPEFGLFVLTLNNPEQVNVLPISTPSKVCPLYI